ncbi:MAG: hypothetical protein AB1530_03045 [Candidatus Omnitrophota bacterium]
MPKKEKFKPVISRVKLNPEQAVLVCSCYNAGLEYTTNVGTRYTSACDAGLRTTRAYNCMLMDELAST